MYHLMLCPTLWELCDIKDCIVIQLCLTSIVIGDTGAILTSASYCINGK